MGFFTRGAGLAPRFAGPPDRSGIEEITTEEAAVCAPDGQALVVQPLVAEGDHVACGQPVVQLRAATDICLVAPISGEVAHLRLKPGRKLSEVVIYGSGAETHQHSTTMARDAAGLRSLMQGAGVWPLIRRRPFGGMPPAKEVPAAIFVMVSDTRPAAPDARRALQGREDDLARGLTALSHLTDGPVFVCAVKGDLPDGVVQGPIRVLKHARLHPQGSAGLCIHRAFPAGIDAPVWDMHAEDVAALGALLATGVLQQRRLVRIAGAGLREGQSLFTHAGADLRQLTRRIAGAGAHVTLSGGPLDGRHGSWLGTRDRQVTVLPAKVVSHPKHWLLDALGQAPRPVPVIPTAAATQAFGAALPAVPFLRALGAGDDEGAMRLGLFSLLEEDVALADYVLGEGGQIMAQLRTMLTRIQTELDE